MVSFPIIQTHISFFSWFFMNIMPPFFPLLNVCINKQAPPFNVLFCSVCTKITCVSNQTAKSSSLSDSCHGDTFAHKGIRNPTTHISSYSHCKPWENREQSRFHKIEFQNLSKVQKTHFIHKQNFMNIWKQIEVGKTCMYYLQANGYFSRFWKPFSYIYGEEFWKIQPILQEIKEID